MSRIAAITRFASGTYSVARYGAVTWSNGVATKPAPTVFSVLASVQPVGGREFRSLPEGRRGDEVRVVYTETALAIGDVLTIGGESWETFKAETWTAWGTTHYRAFVSRMATP